MDRYVEDITKSLTTNMVYEKTFIHPEEYGNEKINDAFSKGFIDVTNIDIKLKELAVKTEDVLSRTVKRLDVVKDLVISSTYLSMVYHLHIFLSLYF